MPLFLHKSDIDYNIFRDFQQDRTNFYENVGFFVFLSMNEYYKNANEQAKAELAETLKNYKLLCAKNAFERFKISLTKSEKLFSPKQK